MKTKVFLVDDEYLAIQEFTWMLKDFEDFQIIGHATNADEAIHKINALQPDVLFLDIQLPEKSGFDIVNALEFTPQIVFVTAFDQFAIQAFEVNAVDYLMKPISPQRLVKCLAKLRAPGEAVASKLFVKNNDSMEFVDIADIVWLESIGNYVRLHHTRGSNMVYRSLSSMETQLRSHGFFRANRKEMFNTRSIQSIQKQDANWVVSLPNMVTIQFSLRQASKFISIFKKETIE